MRNCGKLTANPIAVRLAAALKPFKPKSSISIEGIASEDGSAAVVVESNRVQAMRASLAILLLKTLFRTSVAAFVLTGTIVVNPGGVTCPLPAVVLLSKR